MFSIMYPANSLVFTLVEPGIRRSKSYVTFFCSMVRSMLCSIRSAASFQPRWRNIMTPDRITEPGLITSLSAYFGAVPCVASKMA